MSEEEEKRRQQFATLKRYLEREQARIDREMPGATDKQKSDALAAKMSENLAASEEKKAIENLTAVLRGKKLQRGENQSDSDYSGGGFYQQETETLHLFPNDTFRYEKHRFSTVSSGGLSLPPSEQKRTEQGSWAVEVIDGAPHLVLRTDGSVCRTWRTKDGGAGVQYLDGERWVRYKM